MGVFGFNCEKEKRKNLHLYLFIYIIICLLLFAFIICHQQSDNIFRLVDLFDSMAPFLEVT